MSRRTKKYDDDDGRTIAPMNIEGMPWYVGPSAAGSKKKKPENGGDDESPEEQYRRQLMEEDPDAYRKLDKRETRALMFASFKAAMLVAGVFLIGFTIFICFCVFVWFR